MKRYTGSAGRTRLAVLVWAALAVLVAVPASAEMLVQSLVGDAAQYQLLRGKQEQPLRPLSVLQPGDRVLVSGEQGRLSLVGEDGKVVTVSATNSPYVVPQAETRGWMDNAMLAALDWYQGVNDETTQTVSLVTRGRGPGPLQLRGMVLDDNLLPLGRGEIRFRWAGGTAPYRVTLLDDGGVPVAGAEVGQRGFSHPSDALSAGDYLVRVEGLGDASPQIDEQAFTLVDPAELPDEVRRLQASELAAPLRRHLAAVLLAQYPEWRFAALQLALAAQDSRLSEALLSGTAPAGK